MKVVLTNDDVRAAVLEYVAKRFPQLGTPKIENTWAVHVDDIDVSFTEAGTPTEPDHV